MKTITVLGATGSVGQNTLKVIEANPQDFKIYALSANTRFDLLFEQCVQFQPCYAVLATAALAQKLQVRLNSLKLETKVLFGEDALCRITRAPEVDTVMAAIVGIAGLRPTFSAVTAGKRVLLANKEALVTAGAIFMKAVYEHQATLLPVDSEHNAIFQCLTGPENQDVDRIEKIILTASGGPFRTKALSELKTITPDEACRHPNWSMGRKISVDSSTMMNKALEVIEAYWLFQVPIEKIEVLIHPQSIVHSMVQYCDGSFIAELGSPDMRTPIAYALYYPTRCPVKVPALDLTRQHLTFEAPDLKRFKAIEIVFSLLQRKDYAACIVFNAANEILVAAFLDEKIQYLEIIAYIEQTLAALTFSNPETIDDVMDIDLRTRAFVRRHFLKEGR